MKRVLRLGTVDAVVSNRDLALEAALRQLREQIPTLIIDFSTTGPMELESKLLAGSRDIIIVPSSNKRPEFNYQTLLKEKHSLYCALGHPLFDRPDAGITNEDLQVCPFIARGYLHQYDLQRIGHRDAEATVETMEAQLVLILTGQYIGYLPSHYAESWVQQGRLRCLKDSTLSYHSTIYAVTQPSGGENPLLRRFLSILATK
jgi:DNA-binding transcriptional LysR family regulator